MVFGVEGRIFVLFIVVYVCIFLYIGCQLTLLQQRKEQCHNNAQWKQDNNQWKQDFIHDEAGLLHKKGALHQHLKKTTSTTSSSTP